MAFVLGITGGIGTGKSTVLKLFEGLGAEALSADEIAKDVLKRGNVAFDEVVRRFGNAIVDKNGEIDRPILARRIFSDPESRKDLDAIMHQRIISEVEKHIKLFRETRKAPGSVLAVEVPLLIECGMERKVDKVLVVAAEQGTQVSRLTSRSGISEAEALERISAQMPLQSKIARADIVIWNDGSLENLKREVESIWSEIRLL